MVQSANLGFPRIGAKRELKKAVESFWKGNSSIEKLNNVAKSIRKLNWSLQKNAGVDFIPSNDFSLYDHILDTICLVGAVPKRYNHTGGNVSLDTYFAMARGAQNDGIDVVAMEMTKWFDTNYHYIVPEFTKDQSFELSSTKIFDQYLEAKDLGIETRPVLVGPVSFLLIGKAQKEDNKLASLNHLDKLLAVYKEILQKLESHGVKNIQLDEPYLCMDICDTARDAYKKAYDYLNGNTNLNIDVTTYFSGLQDNTDTAVNLPVNSLHIDLVREESQIETVLNKLPNNVKLSVGIVDGRNIWKNDFEKSFKILDKIAHVIGKERLIVAPSCSLLHCPVDLEAEENLDNDLKSWLAFATQKIKEIAVLTKALNDGVDSVEADWSANKKANDARSVSTKIHNEQVKKRASSISEDMYSRKSDYDSRAQVQRKIFDLPALPTTTIGSFPQTPEVRQMRAKFKKGELSSQEYDKFLEEETVRCIRFQEKIGIDVLVHGEFERNDMVEYFGEKLSGFAFTKFGWVQSYGSRCVKPPIIFGDVSRAEPMTVKWSKFSQDNTDAIMKGMLTGPVTILQWSFVRDDQPRSETCRQIALAIRDEVVDLEKADIKMIQIDEAAMREGLPLRQSEWKDYLKWAVDCFRITASGVEDKTQIHTHMCYSEFNDIIEAVANMDADVISIETSRSQMELLDAFINFKYPNEIGPGVYDIHSPRVPKQSEMETLLRLALKRLEPQQIWVNPDCGLKTRGWPEVESALKSMVDSAKTVRGEIQEGKFSEAG